MKESKRIRLTTCRKLIGGTEVLSDKELATIRDRVYTIVEGLFEAYPHFRAPSTKIFGCTAKDLQQFEAVAAQAATLERDGGFPEKYAQLEAIRQHFAAQPQPSTKDAPKKERRSTTN